MSIPRSGGYGWRGERELAFEPSPWAAPALSLCPAVAVQGEGLRQELLVDVEDVAFAEDAYDFSGGGVRHRDAVDFVFVHAVHGFRYRILWLNCRNILAHDRGGN